jgi:hypothetical protein
MRDRPNNAIEIQRKIAKANEGDRAIFASNPNNTLEILEILAQERTKLVRRAIAQNTNTPANILKNLVRDLHQSVRLAVAKNPQISSKIFFLYQRSI